MIDISHNKIKSLISIHEAINVMAKGYSGLSREIVIGHLTMFVVKLVIELITEQYIKK